MKFVEKTDTCWLWTGNKYKDGYGQFTINKKKYRAHRLALEYHLQRPITENMVVAHTPIICHNRACVNPAHLRECTQFENCQDRKLDGTNNVIVGSKRHNAKLTEEQVIAIRADERQHKDIAADYGVSKGNICQIKLKNLWKHI